MKYVYLTLDDLLDMFDDDNENKDKTKNQHIESDKQIKEESDKDDTLTEICNNLIDLLAEYYGYEDDKCDCQEDDDDNDNCDASCENCYSKFKSTDFNENDVKNIHDKKIEMAKETKQREKIKITKSEALYLLGFDKKDFEIV